MPQSTLKVLSYCLTIILALSQFAMAANEPTEKSYLIPVAENNASADFGKGVSALTSEINQSADFLPVSEAFQVTSWVATDQTDEKSDTLFVSWQIAPDYYLYRHRLAFSQLSDNAPVEALIPAGKAKHDQYFGDVEVYYQQLIIELPAPANNSQEILKISYQGCADAGLCYPPQTLYLQRRNQTVTLSTTAPQNSQMTTPASTSLQQDFTRILASAHLGAIVGLFFLAGLALTFTPCVLPMIPIVSSIVLGQSGRPSRLRAFSLSLTYVLAMTGTYALAGTLTGYFGAGLNLQLKLQSPVMTFTIAALFVAFALAMLGFYELRLPSALHNRLHQISHNQRGGTYVGVALIGVISTLIVSPCVTAPLAGTLVFISSTGDPLLGGMALLSLGLGMGLPLLLIGTFGTQLLPKSGQWMNQIKILFGILLLGLAIWMLDRVLPSSITLILWIALLTGYALQLGVLKLLRFRQGLSILPLLGLLPMLFNGLLIFNATQGHYNPFTPFKILSGSTVELDFKSVDNLPMLQQLLAEQSNDHIVMLDLYADWCVSCLTLEQEVFTAPKVSNLLQNLVLIRADITAGTAEHQALLKHFSLFGPPSLLFFKDQQELRNFRIQGEVDAEVLHRHLSLLLETSRKETATFAD